MHFLERQESGKTPSLGPEGELQMSQQHPKRAFTAAVAAIGFAGLVLGLTACGTTGEISKAADTPSAVTSSAPTSAPAVTEGVPEETTTPTEEPAEDTTTIGKSLTYKSGIVVTVVSVKVFSAGSYASGLSAGHKAVKVTWSIQNKTGESLDLSGAQTRLTYGADGTAAEPVYTEGVGGQFPFEGSVSTGKTKTASSAFSVPKAGLAKITVEVEPEFDSQTAFFTGKAAAK